MHHDIGFSDTVSNVVEIVKEEHRRGRPYGHGHRFARGRNHTSILIFSFTTTKKNQEILSVEQYSMLCVEQKKVKYAQSISDSKH
jgi:hypothetical protein